VQEQLHNKGIQLIKLKRKQKKIVRT